MDVCRRAPMIDGSVLVGTIAVVFYAGGRQQPGSSRSAAVRIVDVCWRAQMAYGSVLVGAVVTVSYAGGRHQPGPSRSAPFGVVILNCADMLRFLLLAHICVCACHGCM